MRRLLALVMAFALIPAFVAGPAAGAEKLAMQIDTVDVPEAPSDTGTFTVNGEGASLLCPAGTWEATNGRIWKSTDSGFKITVDRVFTCDGTGEMFVLELAGTIVFGEGCQNCTWKLKDSTGLDPRPKGKGEIVALSELGESYVGSIKG